MIDSEATLPGWRVLLMMMEHDIHHRSQIDTYAGTQGWPVPDIFGRPWAQIWERYFEDGMQRPDDESIFDFSR